MLFGLSIAAVIAAYTLVDDRGVEADAGGLACRRLCGERDHSDQQDEHRRDASADRVDDRKLGTAIRACEQHDVRELEQTGSDQKRGRLGVDSLSERCHRRVGGHGDHEHDRRRRLNVPRRASKRFQPAWSTAAASANARAVEDIAVVSRLVLRKLPA